MMTDAMAVTTSDQRTTLFDSGANGNVTPPARAFDYTAVNLTSDYTPPTATDTGALLTHRRMPTACSAGQDPPYYAE